MTEEIKWTLAGIIVVIISLVGNLMVLRFATNVTQVELNWIIGISVPCLFVLWGGFVKYAGKMKQVEMDKLIENINKKADREATEAKFREQQTIINDHKETNEAQINAIHEFMASIDSKMGAFDSKLDSLTSYLLNKKR
jgi:hypothetical protein